MSTTELALPTTGDSAAWNERERALVEASGLVRSERNGDKHLADRPTVEAFLAHCRRTGLDPIARQIYAIYRAGKWGIQISIDGARLVAERTGTYEGQTPVEWTADGATWTQVWLAETPPRAARVGVYRRGFREPLYAVANWDSYAVMKDEWKDGRKTGVQVVSDMWKKFGPLMLGKCAEMLALRKAFPQDLSGLYTTEEMAQANSAAPVEQPRQQPTPAPVIAPVVTEPSRDWVQAAEEATSIPQLKLLHGEAGALGELGVIVGDDGQTVNQMLRAKKAAMEAAEEPVEAEVVEDEPAAEPSGERDWVAEARVLEDPSEVMKLLMAAEDAGAPATVQEQLAEFHQSLPKADG